MAGRKRRSQQSYHDLLAQSKVIIEVEIMREKKFAALVCCSFPETYHQEEIVIFTGEFL